MTTGGVDVHEQGAVLILFGLWAFGRAERYAKRIGKLKRVG